MEEALNTLYVTSGNKYLSLDGEKMLWYWKNNKKIGRIPLHNSTGNYYIWVYRSKSGSYGSMYTTKYRSVLYVGKWKISGKSDR